jgi:hypothetical protein
MRGCDGCEAGGRVMSAEAFFKTDQDQPAGDTCLASDEDQPNLKMAERPDWALLRSVEGLQQKAGTLATTLRRLVLKELANNGRRRHQLGAIDEDHYLVEDDGPGLDGMPEEIASLFSIKRPMHSGKLLRVSQPGGARKRPPRRGGCHAGIQWDAGRYHPQPAHCAFPQADGSTSPGPCKQLR